MKPTVSVVISAFNEEKKLPATLDAVSWAAERIVVDNSSTDGTSGIAKKHGAQVFRQPNKLMLNINKNYGFTKAKSDWILNLDADEVVTPELKAEIERVLSDPDPLVNGFWIARKNIIFGKWVKHGLWWPDRQLRLFRRGKGKFPCVHIHEYIEVEGKSENLDEPYIHYNYDSVAQYLSKLDRCTKSEMISLKEAGYAIAWYDAIRFPMSDFIKIYFAQGAFKDGLHGLVLAILQAFYSFLTFARVWESNGFPERDIPLSEVTAELSRSKKELTYWIETKHMEESGNPVGKITHKIKRKVFGNP